MHVYNDHVEIWNEGELPIGYDEEVLYGKHSSKPRNRNIADTMFKAGFIDTWGRGYSKISDGFKSAGLPVPSVKSHCGGTLVSFMRGFDVVSGKRIGGSPVTDNVTDGVTSDVTSLSPVQLNDKQRVICDLIRNNPRISIREMSLVMSLVERTIKRHLATMQKKGILIREGNTSAGRWVLLVNAYSGDSRSPIPMISVHSVGDILYRRQS